MAAKPTDTRRNCSSDKCETSPDAPFNKRERPLGNEAKEQPTREQRDEIEKQKHYYKGGTKP